MTHADLIRKVEWEPTPRREYRYGMVLKARNSGALFRVENVDRENRTVDLALVHDRARRHYSMAFCDEHMEPARQLYPDDPRGSMMVVVWVVAAFAVSAGVGIVLLCKGLL